MARGVTDAQKDWLVLRAGFLERLFAPRIPVDLQASIGALERDLTSARRKSPVRGRGRGTGNDERPWYAHMLRQAGVNLRVPGYAGAGAGTDSPPWTSG